MPEDSILLNALVEAFTEKVRSGQSPDIEAYARENPHLAERIRELFPTLLLLEGLPAAIRRPEPAQPGAADWLEPGRSFGGYRLTREIGRGGMGIVYEAVHVQLEKVVALKLLAAAAHQDSARIERFLREAKTAAGLHHTNIVPVFDFGSVEGLPYYAMQYIEGRGLDQAISDLRGRRPDARSHHRWVAGLGLQAAQGIQHAHERGVIHRDIKPSNLILDGREVLWITDFGLARGSDDAALTQSGLVVGTPRYMSPEQAGSIKEPVDSRSDVYSLGATLYELFTLRPPFDGQTPHQVLAQIAGREPPPPRRVDPTVPRDLETIVLRAMAKRPADRYASAAELGEDLRRWLAFEPIRARPVPAPVRVWRWCRRDPTAASLTACVAALLVVVALGSTLAALRLRDERNSTRQHFWSSLLAQARAKRLSGQPLRRFDALEAVGRAAGLQQSLDPGEAALLELRNEAIAGLFLADLRLRKEADQAASEPAVRAFDGSLELYAVAEPGGSIGVRRTVDDRPQLTIPGTGPPLSALRFSTDGRYLAAMRTEGRNNSVEVWDLTGPESVFTLQSGPFAETLAFSADGGRIAVPEPNGMIHVHDLASRKEERKLRVVPSPRSIRFHPRRELLAAAATGRLGQVVLWDLAENRAVKSLPHQSAVLTVEWSHDGRLLAAGTQSSGLYLWDDTGQLRSRMSGHAGTGRGNVLHVSFSPSGYLLATSGRDGQTALWDVGPQRRLLSISGKLHGFAAGRPLLGIDGHGAGLGTWEVAEGMEHRAFRSRSEYQRSYWSLDFSPDGRVFATAGHTGLRIWEAATQRELAFLPLGRLTMVAFTPGGRSIVTAGVGGIHRWAFECEVQGQAVRIAVGPPSVVDEALNVWRAELSADGRLLASVDPNRQEVVVHELETARRRLVSQPAFKARYVALSPDQRWLAAGVWVGGGVRIWELPLDQAVYDEGTHDPPGTELPVEGGASVAFSPDGRWLAIGSPKEYRFLWTGSWRLHHPVARAPGLTLPGPVAFNQDGTLVAITHTDSLVKILEPATGRELAALECPHEKTEEDVKWLRFSPDSGQLAGGWRYLRLWDLASIRKQLGGLSLDWEEPKAPAGRRFPAVESWSADVRLGDYFSWQVEACGRQIRASPRDPAAYLERARILRKLGRWAEALSDYQTLCREVTPASATSYRELAWALLSAPEGVRDLARSEEAARRGIQLDRTHAPSWTALGVACFRLGRFNDALEALRTSILLQKGEGTAYEDDYLAMTYFRLDRRELAKTFHEKAIAWWQDQIGLSTDALEEIEAIRAEAESLLGGTARGGLR